MKNTLYKPFFTMLICCLVGTVSAQKFDKNFSESFKTKKDVEVAINAANADITVTTWNKNEVQINAYIEVEGVSKEEAEKYFKNWNFEALGNARKVQITAKGSNKFNFKNDFVFFDNTDFDIQIPEIDFTNIETIVLPEMNFDFDFDLENLLDNLEDFDEKIEKSGSYKFSWKDDEHDIKINSKKEWEAFKKTKDYKALKEKMKFNKEKVRVEFAKSKAEMKKALAKSRKEVAKIDKEKIQKELAEVKEKLKSFKQNYNTDKNTIILNSKKVIIKKRIEIKVPKEATFDLNTRHCKVKLPNTVAYGTVKYGSFNANNLSGGKLTIHYAPVTINDLNACTLFLNNVTDAKIASVTNTALRNNSSDVTIVKVNENVNLTDKFGRILINGFNTNFGDFILNLSQSDATLILGTVPATFQYNVNRVKLENKRAGNAQKKSTKNHIEINGDYSSIVIK